MEDYDPRLTKKFTVTMTIELEPDKVQMWVDYADEYLADAV